MSLVGVDDNACFIGLMSGTSVNSVDAVLVRFNGNQPQLIGQHEEPIPAALRAELLALARPGPDELHRLATLDNAIVQVFASACNNLLSTTGQRAEQVQAIGSHGQTVRHAPQADLPYTVQIGNPSLLAELTGITVVADFRRRDMAAGGQGAPLAPAFHAAFFGHAATDRALVNIGGIANLSLLSRDGTVRGFDTGPGNALLDVWTARHLHQTQDTDGAWASTGHINQVLLQHAMNDPYFALPPPKSTGREVFHLDWLEAKLAAIDPTPQPADVQATLAELTGSSIGAALRQHAPTTTALFVCGGGARNPAIMQALQRALPDVNVASTAQLGIDPDYLEAIGFAWLARQTLLGRPGNIPAVTGARGERILGGIYPE